MGKKAGKNRNEKTNSPFQWVLFAGIIPLLFAVVTTLVVLSLAGVNVFEKAKEAGEKIPVISSVIPTDAKEEAARLEARVLSLQSEIEDKLSEISSLQGKITSQEQEKEKLLAEQEQLQAKIEELEQIQQENKRAFKEMISTFETMSAKSAAPVLANMENEKAIKILSNVKPDTLAKILEKMAPEDAAMYTELLSAEVNQER
ncbi:MotE family protein [Rossellomorea vietnamensis]|uniref:MotE family protein n=1 Tax=Rossellomorea aquimaris TaxID=189382 RepID=A0A5D4U5B3_9BACI|nr:MotE family protein [Rossellomorea aquimaris]TYS82468.1 MotE family protein [Rossellomorea aquimaris]